jgi:hypothetical protein
MVASLGQGNSKRILGFASLSLELHLIVDYWTTFGPEFEADSCACSRLKSVVWKLVAAGLLIRLQKGPPKCQMPSRNRRGVGEQLMPLQKRQLNDPEISILPCYSPVRCR